MRVSFVGMLAGLALLAAPVAHAQLITGFEEFDDGANVMFRQPSFSGSTGTLLETTPNSTAVSSEKAFSGTKSLKADWAWKDDDPAKWLRLTAYQTPVLGNPTVDFNQTLSMNVFVEGPGALGIALTVREIPTDPAVGANGGVSGTYEFIGSTTANTPTPTRVVTPGSWQTLVFDFQNDPVAPFANGDGTLSSAFMKGTIDSLAIRSLGLAGPWSLYIDDIRVGADPNAIPEPGSVALLASGLVPLLALRRRTR